MVSVLDTFEEVVCSGVTDDCETISVAWTSETEGIGAMSDDVCTREARLERLEDMLPSFDTRAGAVEEMDETICVDRVYVELAGAISDLSVVDDVGEP
jgi:hypothetical protein